MKITFLLVERTYVGSLRQAVQQLNADYQLGLDASLHILPDVRTEDDWRRLETDVAGSLAVFAIHVTEQAVAERLSGLIDRHGPRLKAFVPINCLAVLMRHAQLGRLRLAEQGGFMSAFGRLIRRPSAQGSAESFAAVLGKVSRWLRFAPGRAQDFRTYLLLYTYYLHSSPENWRNLLLVVLRRYGGVKLEAQPPIEYPNCSLYHPDAPQQFERLEDYLSWFHRRDSAPGPDAARVGLILFRSFVLNGNTAHYDAVIRAVETRGLIPLPALSFALDNRIVQERYFGQASAILSLTGFGYVGGMGANDSAAAVEALGARGVPYLDAVALNFQRIEEWRGSEVGLNPLQSMMQVAIPELDGAIEPFLFGGIGSEAEGFQPMPDRIERLVDRLAGLVRLRTVPNDRKRLAVALFNFPPNRGNLGTAAYLDVFGSLHRLLLRLRDEGYSVDVPPTPDDLRRAVSEGNAGEYGTPANVAATISAADYLRLWPYWQEVEERWGRAPGTLNANSSELFVLGRHFGSVFVGVQPSFGYEGDPLRLLASRGLAPHHGFCAFYVYLQKVWQADVVLHFGTHGSLEFMPGKQIGLSDGCWPDRLIGALPNVYLYSSGNPSEGTIAKRRSYATLVSYLSPPMRQAGLYKDLLGLKDLIDVYRRTGDAELLPEIRSRAEALHLGPAGAGDGWEVDRLAAVRQGRQ